MEFLTTLLSKKGQFINVVYEKPIKQLKGSPHTKVTKEVSLVGRAGVTYDNIQNVKDKRESGELPAENTGLKWGEWLPGGFPYLIKHKDELYARITLGTNNTPKATYRIDGKPVTQKEALAYALASEKPKDDEKPDVLTINLKNIKSIT